MKPKDHLTRVMTSACLDAQKKYDAGQKEHGGRLWRKPIMNYIGDEIIDLVIYWYTFTAQWQKIRDELSLLELDIFAREDVPDEVKARITLLTNLVYTGNIEGQMEEERDARQ